MSTLTLKRDVSKNHADNLKNKNRTILVVDDDRLITTILTTGLTEAKYGVYAVESVDEAEKWLDKNDRPDLVILDMNMPKRSGVELGKKLNEMNKIPFIFLTAYSEDEYVKQAKDSGAMGYLVKPVNMSQIIPAVETAITRSEDFQLLRRTKEMLQTALDGDRAVSVAVGVIMERMRLTHDESFEIIRNKARSNHLKIIDVANSIINASETLNITKNNKKSLA